MVYVILIIFNAISILTDSQICEKVIQVNPVFNIGLVFLRHLVRQVPAVCQMNAPESDVLVVTFNCGAQHGVFFKLILNLKPIEYNNSFLSNNLYLCRQYIHVCTLSC